MLTDYPNQGETYSLNWDASHWSKIFEECVEWVGGIAIPLIDRLGKKWATDPLRISCDQAEITGMMLANLINEKSIFGKSSISLIGFSLGARVVNFCLKELYKINKECNAIHDVYLLGGATDNDVKSFKKCRRVVKGRFVNGYTKKDQILSILFTTVTLERPIGNGEINPDDKSFENVNLWVKDEIEVNCHTEYRGKLDQILKRIGHNL